MCSFQKPRVDRRIQSGSSEIIFFRTLCLDIKSSLIEFSRKRFTYLPVIGPPLYTKHIVSFFTDISCFVCK